MGADGPHQISFYSLNASGVTEGLKTIIIIKDDAPPSTRGAQASAAGSEVQVQVGPATAPVIVEPAPPVEETLPVIEAPAPTVEEPASAIEEPAPAVEELPGEAEPADDPT